MDQSEEMFKLVRKWRKSGLNQGEFCKPLGITVAKFGYWVGKENSSPAGDRRKVGGFVELYGKGPMPSESYQVVYPNGVKVNIMGVTWLHFHS